MSSFKSYFLDFVYSNWERFMWVSLGGWIQIYLSVKKGVKYSKTMIAGSLLVSGFVGYWAGELCEHFGYDGIATFAASMSAIGSNSILNFYSENISKIFKAILKGKFKIDLKEDESETTD